MPFESPHPPIDLPPKESIWSFFFESSHSPLSQNPLPSPLSGYLDASTGRSLSYLDVKTKATALSTSLIKNQHFKPGDTVILFSQNSIWYPVAMFAILRAGGIVSGASPAYGVEEMSYALKTSGAKFLMTHPERLDVALEAAKSVGISRDSIFLLEGKQEGFRNVEELIEGASSGEQVPAWKGVQEKGNKNVCAFLSFSSGTTGLPKAVIAQCLQMIQITPKLERVLAVLPLFHITGLVHILHLPILLNAQVIMLPSFSMPTMLSTVIKYKIKELLLVPPLLIRLVRDPEVDRHDLSHIERFSSGAAPLSEEILQLLQKKFPNTGFKQGYGMTESCSCITGHPPSHYSYKYAHAVGQIVPSTSVKIIKEDGTEAGINEPGEILARGPQITMGYLNNSKATADTYDKEGYLHTGDQGSIDAQGLLTITDRIKEMIKVNGHAVAPAELEDLLLGHSAVEDVAVLGIPDAMAGEVPKAFVVVKAEFQDREQEVGKKLLEYVKEKKIRYKWLSEVEFVDVIPKSPSGKILRRVLKGRKKNGEVGILVKEVGKAKAKL
ncbi:acetyl-CoA synthetase-like protein [Aureobasidium subglaciale]|nr:acetyl-CoA synthetase-like protein [Aureobasidium subglaciale]KAI5229685.1 acetyl-CoA synthetase-like protein [Aureobasidium subglaciale]KAI5233325.1 acetyl-CoA synthetase-like protein [Aureobasidium subglaciale]KAI5266582.1 acetyl-CoA synthetase-like protein [Aureobasidium subglaciale]